MTTQIILLAATAILLLAAATADNAGLRTLAITAADLAMISALLFSATAADQIGNIFDMRDIWKFLLSLLLCAVTTATVLLLLWIVKLAVTYIILRPDKTDIRHLSDTLWKEYHRRRNEKRQMTCSHSRMPKPTSGPHTKN